MKISTIEYILNYIEEHKSTKTTPQIFNHFKKLDITKELVYAFPYMTKGNIQSFETLLSKKYIKSVILDRETDVNKDILESLLNN